MSAKEKLLKRLPKKYHGMVLDLVPEGGLVDDCQYMLYFNEHVSFCGYEECGGFPVKSITEAVRIIKEDCEMKDESIDDILDEITKDIEQWY